MNGAEWLDTVLERGLRIGDPAAYPELLGGLTALAACGVLSEDQVRTAQARLDERFAWLLPTIPPARPEIRPASRQPAAHDVLEFAFAPAAPLADADGITVILTTVELWTSGTFVRLAGLRSAHSDELDARFEEDLAGWVKYAPADPASGATHPRQPGELLTRLPLTLSDDVGTLYHSPGRLAGGTGTEWRAEWRFEPGVPQQTTRLTVTVEGAHSEQTKHDLALPR